MDVVELRASDQSLLGGLKSSVRPSMAASSASRQSNSMKTKEKVFKEALISWI